LLLCRLLAAISYSVWGNNSYQDYYVTSIAVIAIVILAIANFLPRGVYTKRYNNIIESSMLLNLLLISAAGVKNKQSNIKNISLVITILIFTSILSWYCIKKIGLKTCLLKIGLKLKIKKAEPGTILEQEEESSANPKYKSFTQDREPLLASFSQMASYS